MTSDEIESRARTLQRMLQHLGIGDGETENSFEDELKAIESALPDSPKVAAIRYNFTQVLSQSGSMQDRSRLNLGISITEFRSTI
jgi:hypothetical protein